LIPGGSLVNSGVSAITGSSAGSMAMSAVSGDPSVASHNNDGLSAPAPSIAVAAGTLFVEQQNADETASNRVLQNNQLPPDSQHTADIPWDSSSILSKPINLRLLHGLLRLLISLVLFNFQFTIDFFLLLVPRVLLSLSSPTATFGAVSILRFN